MPGEPPGPGRDHARRPPGPGRGTATAAMTRRKDDRPVSPPVIHDPPTGSCAGTARGRCTNPPAAQVAGARGTADGPAIPTPRRHGTPTSGPASGPAQGSGIRGPASGARHQGPDIRPGTGARHQARHRGPAHPTPRHPGRALWTARGCNPPRPVPDSAMPHHAPAHHAPPRVRRRRRIATPGWQPWRSGCESQGCQRLRDGPATPASAPGKALCPAAGLAALIAIARPPRRIATGAWRSLLCQRPARPSLHRLRHGRPARNPGCPRTAWPKTDATPAPRPAGGMTGGQRPVPCRSGRRRGAFPYWPFGARGDRQTPRPRPRPPRRWRPMSRQWGRASRCPFCCTSAVRTSLSANDRTRPQPMPR